MFVVWRRKVFNRLVPSIYPSCFLKNQPDVNQMNKRCVLRDIRFVEATVKIIMFFISIESGALGWFKLVDYAKF